MNAASLPLNIGRLIPQTTAMRLAALLFAVDAVAVTALHPLALPPLVIGVMLFVAIDAHATKIGGATGSVVAFLSMPFAVACAVGMYFATRGLLESAGYLS